MYNPPYLRPQRRVSPMKILATLFNVAAIGATLLASIVPVAAETQRALPTNTSEKVDAVLLLDTSGSMLVNDPKRLRDEGARLFLQFLKPGDQLAVVEFSDTPKVIRPLSPFETTDAETVGKLIGALPSEGEFTDLLAAVQQAESILSAGRREARPIAVLLSDGKMEPNPAHSGADQATHKLLEEILPEMKTRGQKIYTLALSNDADRELLRHIAASTDSVMWFTPNAETIHESYADLFLAVKKPQVIPLSAKGFSIDAGVDEATFYVNREGATDISLLTPSAATITAESPPPNVKWFHSEKFDVVTITKPDVGNWKITGISHDEGFATILTNLKLITDWPPAVDQARSELLQVRLYESDKPVALPEMSGSVRYAFQITPTDKIAEPVLRDFLVDDGTKGDKIAGDGIFSYAVKLDQAGQYKLRVIANAPTFERQLQIPFRVREPLLTLSVVEHEAAPAEESNSGEVKHSESSESSQSESTIHGNEFAVLTVSVSEELLVMKNPKIQIVAVDEKKSRFSLPVKHLNDRLYESSASALPHDGAFELRASLSAEGSKGTEIRETSNAIVFTRASTTPLTSTDEHHAAPTPPTQPSEGPLNIVGLIIVTVLNVIGGAVALSLLQKSQGKMELVEAPPPLPKEVLDAIADLEGRAATAEVDIDALLAEQADDSEAPSPAPAADTPEPAPETTA